MSSPLDVEENRQDCTTTINEQPKNSVALLRFPASKNVDNLFHVPPLFIDGFYLDRPYISYP